MSIFKLVSILGVTVLFVLPLWALDPLKNQEAPYVEVTGESKVTALADQIRLGISLETKGHNAKEAQQENSRQTQALLEAVKKLGVADKDIQTTMWNVRPIYNNDGGKKRLQHYEAKKSFGILLRSIELYGPIVEASMQAGVERIEGVDFLSSKKDQLEEDARKLAAADAKKNAQALAEVLNQKVGKPLMINEMGFSFGPMMAREMMPMRMVHKSLDSVPEDEVSPGEIVIQGSVRVRFELE